MGFLLTEQLLVDVFAETAFADSIKEILRRAEEQFDQANQIDLRLPQLADRPDNCIALRISKARDYEGAAQLLVQTAAMYPDIAGISEVAAAGSLPLRQGTGKMPITVRGKRIGRGKKKVDWDADVVGLPDNKIATKTVEVQLHEIVFRTARAVLFCHRSQWYLFCLTSAAETDEAGINAWTQLLIVVLERLRPLNLRTVAFSRYVRSDEQAGKLLSACIRNVEVVHAGHLAMEMTGSGALAGRLLFSLFAIAAALERDWIVGRNLAGKIVKALAGKWVIGKGAVLRGTVLDSDGRLALHPDAYEREKVGQILAIIASAPSSSRFLARLIEIGVRPAPGVQDDGSTREHDYAKSASAGIYRQYLRMVEAWVTGSYMWVTTSPFPGAKEIAGVPVLYDSADGRGTIAISLPVPRPRGGWASEEIESAALLVAKEGLAQRAARYERHELAAGAAAGAEEFAGSVDRALTMAPTPTELTTSQIRRSRRNGVERARLRVMSSFSWTNGKWEETLVSLNHGLHLVRWAGANSARADQTADVSDQ